MKPTITPIRAEGEKPFYLVTFATLADRTRWLAKHDFHYRPLEGFQARWTSSHNGSDFMHSLEIIPYDSSLWNNPRALCMRVYVSSIIQQEVSIAPINGRPPKTPAVKGSPSSKESTRETLNLPSYLRNAQS